MQCPAFAIDGAEQEVSGRQARVRRAETFGDLQGAPGGLGGLREPALVKLRLRLAGRGLPGGIVIAGRLICGRKRDQRQHQTKHRSSATSYNLQVRGRLNAKKAATKSANAFGSGLQWSGQPGDVGLNAYFVNFTFCLTVSASMGKPSWILS